MDTAHIVAAVRGGDATGLGDCIPLCRKHMFPELDRIISDILKYPKALKALGETKGGM